VVITVRETHVPRRLEFDCGDLMAGHKILDHGQHVIADIGVGGRQGMDQRVAECGMHRGVGIPLAKPAVVQADGPCHIVEVMAGRSSLEPGDRAAIGRDQGIDAWLQSPVFRKVRLKIE
jgi:hypothetical protein